MKEIAPFHVLNSIKTARGILVTELSPDKLQVKKTFAKLFFNKLKSSNLKPLAKCTKRYTDRVLSTIVTVQMVANPSQINS